MSEGIKINEKADINSEESLLDTVQTANAYEMSKPLGQETESIADKVRARLGVHPTQSADLAVAVGRVRDDSGKPAGERLWVQAGLSDPKYPNTKNYKLVPVASTFEGAVLPEDGFVDEEALALGGMVEGLREAKRVGALTRLSPDLTSITDHSISGMTKLPPINSARK